LSTSITGGVVSFDWDAHFVESEFALGSGDAALGEHSAAMIGTTNLHVNATSSAAAAVVVKEHTEYTYVALVPLYSNANERLPVSARVEAVTKLYFAPTYPKVDFMGGSRKLLFSLPAFVRLCGNTSRSQSGL
jgi:hypothetical protein